MSLEALVAAYTTELSFGWRSNLSSAERVWMLVHEPSLTRELTAQTGRFENATVESGKSWGICDLTDAFGTWLAGSEDASAVVADPRDLVDGLLNDFVKATVARIAGVLQAADDRTVVALTGVASLHPFARVSHVIEDVAPNIRGRLLVFFPGSYRADGNSFRLLGVRDGFNYRARPITAAEDA